MASIVVYKVNGSTENRFEGMKEAGRRIALATAATQDPDIILIKTIDDFIADAQYRVKYTHSDMQEYQLSLDGAAGNGKYKYTAGSTLVNLKIKAQIDKVDNKHDGTPDITKQNMNLTAPRDAVSLATGSYLDKVLADVGAAATDDNRRYLFGTIILRRCR